MRVVVALSTSNSQQEVFYYSYSVSVVIVARQTNSSPIAGVQMSS